MMRTYPIAMQHTLCYSALALTEIMLNPKSWTQDSLPTVEKLTRWMHEAADGIKKKPLSAGAKRALEKMYNKCEQFCKSGDGGEMIAAIFLCAIAHLIVECKIMCPAWAHGRAWYYLDKMMTNLLKDSLKRYPDSGEPGVKLYEDICIAGGF